MAKEQKIKEHRKGLIKSPRHRLRDDIARIMEERTDIQEKQIAEWLLETLNLLRRWRDEIDEKEGKQ